MPDWDHTDIVAFVEKASKETFAREIEGPARLGMYTVWRVWTEGDDEFHAHYVIAEDGKTELSFKRDFAPFSLWLMKSFEAKDAHQRRLDWFRSGVAAIIILALLFLALWAAQSDRAINIDYRWIVATLGASAVAYLLGSWAQRR